MCDLFIFLSGICPVLCFGGTCVSLASYEVLHCFSQWLANPLWVKGYPSKRPPPLTPLLRAPHRAWTASQSASQNVSPVAPTPTRQLDCMGLPPACPTIHSSRRSAAASAASVAMGRARDPLLFPSHSCQGQRDSGMVVKGVRILNRECQCYVSVSYGADTQSVSAVLCQFQCWCWDMMFRLCYVSFSGGAGTRSVSAMLSQFQGWRWYTICFGHVTSVSVVALVHDLFWPC